MKHTIDLDFSKLSPARRAVLAWRLLRGLPTRVSESIAWWQRPAADELDSVQRWQHFDAIASGPIDLIRRAHDAARDDGGEP